MKAIELLFIKPAAIVEQHQPLARNTDNQPAKVDSHVHFYDAERPGGIEWPGTDSPYYGQRLPADYAATNPNSACIAVETSRRSADDRWLANLSAQHPAVKAVVLNLQPDKPDFEGRLEWANLCPMFVGIRLRPIHCYDWSSPTLMKNLGLLARSGKTIEFGAVDDSLKSTFAQLAARFSQTTWVLNHAGHPPDDSGADDDWQRTIKRIAQEPNVVIKVSKLGTDSADRADRLKRLHDAFGGNRLLFASNWPLCSSAEFGQEQLGFYNDVLGSDGTAFFGANAQRAYGLEPSANVYHP